MLPSLPPERNANQTSLSFMYELAVCNAERISVLQKELSAVRAQETKLSEKLNAMHSQLEAQLLTNLEQEEDIRSGTTKHSSTKTLRLVLI